MRHASSSGAGAGYRTRLAWWKKGRIAAAGAAAVAALAGTSMAGVPAASASPSETVIVTADGLLSPAAAVLEVGGTVLTQYHLIDGVDALIPTAEEPLLAAMPGITVTPDASVSVQSTTESTGPHTPSDAFLTQTGAGQLAAAGDTGQGVTVAVLDTGIDPLPDFAGRLIGGVDLTNANNPYQDSFGHGTFVAGLIAGNGASSNGQYSGEAPGADPLVITVGALDDMGGTSVSADEMNDFSSAGPTSPDGWIKPDLVTSGRSVVSLAAPGSTIYNNHPSARIGTANFVGSGTSFSAAITSGAAALVLAANPGLSPNQVKARLLANTSPGPVGNPFVDGHGALDALGAATSGPLSFNQSTAGLRPPKYGTTVSLSPTSPVNTWNTALWSGISPAPPGNWSWNGTGWNGSNWNGWVVVGRAWNDGGWNGAAWNGDNWAGSAWDGTAWSGSAWDGSAWNSSAWN